MNRINILGIKYCDIDIAEAVEHSVRAISAREGGFPHERTAASWRL